MKLVLLGGDGQIGWGHAAGGAVAALRVREAAGSMVLEGDCEGSICADLPHRARSAGNEVVADG